jgi:hypothetical protein
MLLAMIMRPLRGQGCVIPECVWERESVAMTWDIENAAQSKLSGVFIYACVKVVESGAKGNGKICRRRMINPMRNLTDD